jgi:zinc protease
MICALVVAVLLPYLATNSEAQSKIDFQEFDLPNGLHVILHRDDANPIVSVDLWYMVGSKDEDPGHTGFAHLFEHIMFQGSKNVGKTEHFSYIQKAGGTLNGTTNSDRTNYFETVPSNQLELVLWLESDRMMQLNVTQENFDNQREVVKEEKRQRYDNRPYGTWSINLYNRAFPNHPYYMPPIGSMKDLNEASLEYAQSFYKKYYAPDNAVIVVSGDINYEETKKLIEKYFGDIPSARTDKKDYPDVSLNTGEIIDTIYEKVQLPAIFIGYKTYGVRSKDYYTLQILSSLLADGKSSRLYKDIVYNKKLAKSVNSFVADMQLAGLFIVNSTAYQHTELKQIEDEIDAQIESLKTKPVSPHELEKVKNSVENDFTNMRQTTMGKAELLVHYYVYLKNTELINSDIKNYLDVTPEDIMNSANKYFSKDNRVILYFSPIKLD